MTIFSGTSHKQCLNPAHIECKIRSQCYSRSPDSMLGILHTPSEPPEQLTRKQKLRFSESIDKLNNSYKLKVYGIVFVIISEKNIQTWPR